MTAAVLKSRSGSREEEEGQDEENLQKWNLFSWDTERRRQLGGPEITGQPGALGGPI